MKRSERHRAAVALAYSEEDNSPRVAAKGRGLLAETIIARAREAGIYVHESPQLVALLMQVDLDANIPEELYITVAELLAWLYRLEHAPGSGAQSVTSGRIIRPGHGTK